jgi:DNA mismatch repair protein MutL
MMPDTIHVLSPHVADLIAAGEVVERPASAVKELIENAIDAGASAITVESAGGGVRLLRVTDNGCGMAPGDAERAFLRHATSKIRLAGDLSAVTTLGFRGEALAAVSAVSRIQLLTRLRGASLGTLLNLEAGRVAECREAGCPEGTTIVVRDLFYNTPARQKFLKKDVTETAHIQTVCQRAALSHPGISFQYLKDGRQSFLTPGDGLLRSCLYNLYGRDFTGGLCEVEYTQGDIRVWGFVSRPEAAQGSRSAQHVLVAGRPVRSRTVTAALEEAYKHALTAGKVPACVLHIELPPADCDVNVHPAKSEIKFARDRVVFDMVYFAVKNALESLERPSFQIPDARNRTPEQNHSGQIQLSVSRTFTAFSELAGGSTQPVRDATVHYNSQYQETGGASPDFQQRDGGTAAPRNAQQRDDGAAVPHTQFRFIGEVLGGYLLAETSDGLALIDKHAAHERILFNRLKTQAGSPMAQTLITPLTVPMPPVEASQLLEHAELLSGMGFTVESFGGDTLAVRAAPADVEISDIPVLLGEIAARLREGKRDPAPQLFDGLLHLVACKAAVKVGRNSRPEEAETLVRQVMDDPNLRHCPHGRPVCVVLSRGDIERQFKR